MTAAEHDNTVSAELMQAISSGRYDNLTIVRDQPGAIMISHHNPATLITTDVTYTGNPSEGRYTIDMRQRRFDYTLPDTIHSLDLNGIGMPLSPVDGEIDRKYRMSPVQKQMLGVAERGMSLFNMAYRPLHRQTFEKVVPEHNVSILNTVQPVQERSAPGETIRQRANLHIEFFCDG
ncbi:MAG: hypothetical protein TR69_WS6001001120 [candidate division WS6 bacterium OLB20]|uniref:Uncharacterized protein n=1 Tax=candidate division WS6 bacterium OLB20 TaxID=1617426 RepID=A0A136LZL7_9BACT|nr:MAG: hypothetical protein TR69_WS6001001120 [candidate division WS6 bacterium OLB20]